MIILYVSAQELGIQGAPLADPKTPYRRFPDSWSSTLPSKVVDLAEMAAGLYVDFCTDSSEIHARIRLIEDPDHIVVGFPHGLDLYTNGPWGWTWAGVLKNMCRPQTQGPLVTGVPPGIRNYRLYLPYSAKVDSLEIGVVEGAMLLPSPSDLRPPVVCYGTSIVHGYNASRPGMTLPALLGRKLDFPVVNLGFAGNARMDSELLPGFAKLSPSVFVVDCMPNMTPELVKERMHSFATHLRIAWPDIPILLVENIVYQATYGLADKRGGWGPKNEALKSEYALLLQEGISGLYYLTGEGLLGCDGDATVDGTHPSDLGMMRLTRAYASAIMPLLP